jgi:hypothetical protein
VWRVCGAEFRRFAGEPLIALKKLQILRICHASMLLAFWGSGVLGCRRVPKLAAASGTVSVADNLAKWRGR